MKYLSPPVYKRAPKIHRPGLWTSALLIAFAFFYFTSTSPKPRNDLLSYFHEHVISSSSSDPSELSGDLLDSHACRIWSDWPDSDPSKISYGSSSSSAYNPVIGDPAVIGDADKCFHAGSRLDRYERDPLGRNWSDVRWGRVQNECAKKSFLSQTTELDDDILRPLSFIESAPSVDESVTADATGKSRTAIVLRTWDDFQYTYYRRGWLRALITETALHTGGEYQVFLLVNVKNSDKPMFDIFDDAETYYKTLNASVPEEFRDMALLYNDELLENWYPRIPEHGAQDQMYQALQLFSAQHPEYEHIWQLEMDLRLTGHTYKTLRSISRWAKNQRRRNLWERNGRFYISELYNNSYPYFTTAVDFELSDANTPTIWGPAKTTDFEPKGPVAPPIDGGMADEWGVGEEADLITLMPMWDPKGSDWIYENYTRGFADGNDTPRRVAIVSMTRTSRRLLHLIHNEQRNHGRWVVSESTAETFTLLHGLKGVYAPHPIAFDAEGATSKAVDEVVHKGPVSNKAGGYKPAFAYSKTGIMRGLWDHATWFYKEDIAGDVWNEYVGGKCVRPLLLHPVKNV